MSDAGIFRASSSVRIGQSVHCEPTTPPDNDAVPSSTISIVTLSVALTGIAKADGIVMADLEFPNLKVLRSKVILLPFSIPIQMYIRILMFLYKISHKGCDDGCMKKIYGWDAGQL